MCKHHMDAEAHTDAEAGVAQLLEAFGLDLNHESTRDTPRRFVGMLKELTVGLRMDPPAITCFEEGIEYDQMIVIRGIEFWSLCEHHLAPVRGYAHVAYMPGPKKMGLSKAARVVDFFARRPQTQERMTTEIADFLFNHEDFNPRGVMIVASASHQCMTMRGVEKPHSDTVTTAIRGDIDKNEVYKMLSLHHALRSQV